MTDRTAARLLDLYKQGIYTRWEIIALAWDWVDPADPTSVLDGLPDEDLNEMLASVPTRLVGGGFNLSHGDPPTPEETRVKALAVQDLIEGRRGQRRN